MCFLIEMSLHLRQDQHVECTDGADLLSSTPSS